MNASREGLLQPTLGEDARPAAAPYSVQATFFTAFLGGPFAAIAITAVNSWRLRRVGRDWPALAACLVAAVFLGWAIHGSAPAVAPLRDWLNDVMGERSARHAYRLLAFFFVGVGYLLHRKAQRNADVFGLSRPNAWLASVLCILGGLALLAGLIAVVAPR